MKVVVIIIPMARADSVTLRHIIFATLLRADYYIRRLRVTIAIDAAFAALRYAIEIRIRHVTPRSARCHSQDADSAALLLPRCCLPPLLRYILLLMLIRRVRI